MTTPLIMTPAHGGPATFGPLASTVLAQADSQADSVATWSAVGQWVGALGTIAAVALALWLAAREHRRSGAERRDREVEQARLITIAVDYSDYDNPPPDRYAMAWVVITNNNGAQRVLRPEIEQVRGDQLRVRYGPAVSAKGGEPYYSRPEVLMPLAQDIVPFEHVDDEDRIVDPAEAVDRYTLPQVDFSADNVPYIVPKITTPSKIKKRVEIDNVTITFTDMSKQRWRRTGNREPVRVF